MSFPYNTNEEKVHSWWDHCLCGVCTHVHMGFFQDSGCPKSQGCHVRGMPYVHVQCPYLCAYGWP